MRIEKMKDGSVCVSECTAEEAAALLRVCMNEGEAVSIKIDSPNAAPSPVSEGQPSMRLSLNGNDRVHVCNHRGQQTEMSAVHQLGIGESIVIHGCIWRLLEHVQTASGQRFGYFERIGWVA